MHQHIDSLRGAYRPYHKRVERCDLIVIGGGSAGTSAAIEGARVGAKVMIVNDGPIGGTCVNVGCVPSKYLLKVAGILKEVSYPGVAYSVKIRSFHAVMQGLASIVERYRKEKYEDVLANHGVHVVSGKAEVLSPRRVKVGRDTIEGDAIVVATGSSTNVPKVEGLENLPYLTNVSLFSLRELPEKLLIIGGGYVGVEMAQAFRRMGSEVVLIHRGKHLLSHEDEDLAMEVESFLRDEGIEVLTGITPTKAQGKNGEIEITLNNGYVVEGSHILIATGRRGNAAGMGLESLGVEVDSRGFVKTNGRMETSVPGVYAAGDVVGPPMYVYVAAREGKVAALNALAGAGGEMDYRAVPFVIFTHPQVAGVGPTERQLQIRGVRYQKSVLPAKDVPVEGIVPGSRGFVKVIKGEDGRLLSVRAVMRNAGELIMTAATSISRGMKVEEMADLFFPYLTHTEGLRLAALSFDRDVEDMSCCAG